MNELVWNRQAAPFDLAPRRTHINCNERGVCSARRRYSAGIGLYFASAAQTRVASATRPAKRGDIF